MHQFLVLCICNARVRVIFLCFSFVFCRSVFYSPDHTKAAFILEAVLSLFVCVVSVVFVCFVFSRLHKMQGNEHKQDGANITARTTRKPLLCLMRFLSLFCVSERLVKHNIRQRIAPNVLFLTPKRFYLRISIVISQTLKHALKTS